MWSRTIPFGTNTRQVEASSFWKSGNASAVKTRAVVIRILVSEGEPVGAAYRRLQELVEKHRGRPSHKRRFGYYEKPSELSRKRRKFQLLQIASGGRLRLHVHPYERLYRRTGASNVVMR